MSYNDEWCNRCGSEKRLLYCVDGELVCQECRYGD